MRTALVIQRAQSSDAPATFAVRRPKRQRSSLQGWLPYGTTTPAALERELFLLNSPPHRVRW